MKILAVIVNYGTEQLYFLEQMIFSLKNFEKYDVHIIVHSNIKINIGNIDELKIIKLDDYKFLPMTCRDKIWKNQNEFDLFFYSENDLLIKEIHFDKHLEYEKILPKNRISGLIQYEFEN